MPRALRVGDVVRFKAEFAQDPLGNLAVEGVAEPRPEDPGLYVVFTSCGWGWSTQLERRTKKGRWKPAGPLKGAAMEREP